MQTLMKCSIMLHFIWVCTVCQGTLLGVSSLQRVRSDDNYRLSNSCKFIGQVKKKTTKSVKQLKYRVIETVLHICFG